MESRKLASGVETTVVSTTDVDCAAVSVGRVVPLSCRVVSAVGDSTVGGAGVGRGSMRAESGLSRLDAESTPATFGLAGGPKSHGVAMTTIAVRPRARRNRLSICNQGTIRELDRSRRHEEDGTEQCVEP